MGKHFSKAVYFKPTEYNNFNQCREYTQAVNASRFARFKKQPTRKEKGFFGNLKALLRRGN